jgi:hypothetical protein
VWRLPHFLDNRLTDDGVIAVPHLQAWRVVPRMTVLHFFVVVTLGATRSTNHVEGTRSNVMVGTGITFMVIKRSSPGLNRLCSDERLS